VTRVKVVRKGSGGYPEVIAGQQQTPGTKQQIAAGRSDWRCYLGDQEVDGLGESCKLGDVALGVRCCRASFIDLAPGDDADGQALVREGGDQLDNIGSAVEEADDPVNVKQVFHASRGRLGGA
jgi:hypothetical protein